MEIFKIDSTICDYYSDTKEDEEGANIIVGWCHDNGCECSEVPFDECLVKAIQYCKLKDKQLKRKKQECEELKETFDGLFKVQYKLADNNKKLRQCITEIKEIAEKIANYYDGDEYELMRKDAEQILQKISECEVE